MDGAVGTWEVSPLSALLMDVLAEAAKSQQAVNDW